MFVPPWTRKRGGGIVEKHVYVLAAYRLYGIKKKKKLTFNLPYKDVQHLLAKLACHDEYPPFTYNFIMISMSGWWGVVVQIQYIYIYILVAEIDRKCKKKKQQQKKQQKTTSNLLYYSL